MKNLSPKFITPFISLGRFFDLVRIKDQDSNKNPPVWVTTGIFILEENFFICDESLISILSGILRKISSINVLEFIINE